MSVNEWPVPTTLTRRPADSARLTRSTRSPSVAGCSTIAGAHRWFPAQFDQTAPAVRATRGLPLGLEGLDQLGQHLVDVADDAEVGDGEDRRFLVLVDGDDVLGA